MTTIYCLLFSGLTTWKQSRLIVCRQLKRFHWVEGKLSVFRVQTNNTFELWSWRSRERSFNVLVVIHGLKPSTVCGKKPWIDHKEGWAGGMFISCRRGRNGLWKEEHACNHVFKFNAEDAIQIHGVKCLQAVLLQAMVVASSILMIPECALIMCNHEGWQKFLCHQPLWDCGTAITIITHGAHPPVFHSLGHCPRAQAFCRSKLIALVEVCSIVNCQMSTFISLRT